MKILLPLVALLLASSATAAETDTCGATPAAPPAHFSDWAGPSALASATSATSAAGLAQAGFKVGEAVELKLHPDGEVAYQTLPQGEGEASSYGGMARFTVTEPGLYQVGLGSPAWVDVVRDGKAQPTVAFGHGPACTGIRKVVSFQLQPGDYALEISGSEGADIRVIVGKSG
ncbi:MAG: homogentisate 1,2-dioxygenase [Porphyrobacter sp.]|nr:homogentisate 1,2-dioxygenase [Porphyrobacter sp.]